MSHHRFIKQPDLGECSRDYLEALVERLEASQAAGETINVVFLDHARAAIRTAPRQFITHEL